MVLFKISRLSLALVTFVLCASRLPGCRLSKPSADIGDTHFAASTRVVCATSGGEGLDTVGVGLVYPQKRLKDCGIAPLARHFSDANFWKQLGQLGRGLELICVGLDLRISLATFSLR